MEAIDWWKLALFGGQDNGRSWWEKWLEEHGGGSTETSKRAGTGGVNPFTQDDEEDEETPEEMLRKLRQRLSEPSSQPGSEYTKQAKRQALFASLTDVGAGIASGNVAQGFASGTRTFNSTLQEALDRYNQEQREAQQRQLQAADLALQEDRLARQRKEEEEQKAQFEALRSQMPPEWQALLDSAPASAKVQVAQKWLATQGEAMEPPRVAERQRSIDPRTGRVITQRYDNQGNLLGSTESAGVSTQKYGVQNRPPKQGARERVADIARNAAIERWGPLVQDGSLANNNAAVQMDKEYERAQRPAMSILEAAQKRVADSMSPTGRLSFGEGELTIDGKHVRKVQTQNGEAIQIGDQATGEVVTMFKGPDGRYTLPPNASPFELVDNLAKAMALNKVQRQYANAPRTTSPATSPRSIGPNEHNADTEKLSITPSKAVDVGHSGQPAPPASANGRRPTAQDIAAAKQEMDQLEAAMAASKQPLSAAERRKHLQDWANQQGLDVNLFMALIEGR